MRESEQNFCWSNGVFFFRISSRTYSEIFQRITPGIIAWNLPKIAFEGFLQVHWSVGNVLFRKRLIILRSSTKFLYDLRKEPVMRKMQKTTHFHTNFKWIYHWTNINGFSWKFIQSIVAFRHLVRMKWKVGPSNLLTCGILGHAEVQGLLC